jgi:hypothetical protein
MAAPKTRKAKTGRRTRSRPLGAHPNEPIESKAAGPAGPGSGTVQVAAPEAEPGAGLPRSLALSAHSSAARSGRARLEERIQSHPETGPALTGGDLDADWEAAYSVGDEAAGGDNPTPGQDGVCLSAE